MKRPSSCIIVGAGLSGLLAARTLQANSVKITILEKSRGVGGRMATRRIGNSIADHGAQFLTASTEEFASLLRVWAAAGLIVPWFESSSGAESESPGAHRVRYRSVPSMTAIPKELARGLDVKPGQRVLRAMVTSGRWDCVTDQGLTFSAESLLLTSPVPQSLALFESGRYPFPSDHLTTLRAIRYDPCIALLCVLDGPSTIPPPGGIQMPDGPVRWIADNQMKGISPTAALTVHMTPDFSQLMFEAPDAQIISAVRSDIEHWCGSTIIETQIHRWRYAEPRSVAPSRALLARAEPPLLFAGDAFGGPRIEGAALSGLDAAALLLKD